MVASCYYLLLQTLVMSVLLMAVLSLIGFTELCQDDQIKLIKQGSFEVILSRYVPLFTEDGMFVPDMTIKVPRSVCFVYLRHLCLL